MGRPRPRGAAAARLALRHLRFVDVAPLLASARLSRHHPVSARLWHDALPLGATVRNGQQAALATDIVALLDALKIDKAIVGGFDWGARTADIMAALWPERCKALVSVSGYLIGSQKANRMRPCRRRPNWNGGTSSTSPPSAAAPATTNTGTTSPS
jgi:pimeloyl-ACP methyl ester carboxylesterase